MRSLGNMAVVVTALSPFLSTFSRICFIVPPFPAISCRQTLTVLSADLVNKTLSNPKAATVITLSSCALTDSRHLESDGHRTLKVLSHEVE